MQYINPENGSVSTGDRIITRRSTRQEILQQFKVNIRPQIANAAWTSYIIEDNTLLITLYFKDHTIESLTVFPKHRQLPAATDWDNWSEQQELERKELNDLWLQEQVGEKHTFAWGTIESVYDPKGGSSSIVLKYNIQH
ncbi:hypothetical protein ACTHGU_07820 [Chitinophagaceae bacterium MMS25-I14]